MPALTPSLPLNLTTADIADSASAQLILHAIRERWPWIKRWVVERAFSWMTHRRRLVRDYEKHIDVSKAMIHVTMGSLLLRRISLKCILKRTLRNPMWRCGFEI